MVSATTMPMPARSRAAAVVTMVMMANFWRIGRSRNGIMAGASFLHQPGNVQQSGTDLERSLLGPRLADIEADTAVLQHKGDDAALTHKGRALADGQHAGTEAGDDASDILLPGGDKDNLAGLRRGKLGGVLNYDAASSGRFTLDDLFQNGTEGIPAENADGERGCGVRKGIGRPLNEAGEVQEVGSLDVVFGGL